MRRFFSLALGAAIVLSLCVTALAAEGRPIYLKEMGMEITIPDEFAVFTRDNVPTDSELDPEQNAPLEYCDEMTGTVFQIPGGWNKDSEEKSTTDFTATFRNIRLEEFLGIRYESWDLYEMDKFWNVFEEFSKKELTRGDIKNSLFSVEQVAVLMGIDQEGISLTNYGNEEYFYSPKSANGFTTALMRIENGYAYFLQFTGDESNPYFTDFETFVESIEYPVIEKEQEVADAALELYLDQYSPINLLTSLIMTVAIYSLPIFIYRGCIRRYPVEKKKAKIITIVYGIVSWIAMSAILFTIRGDGVAGSAVFLWSWINYAVLIGGKDRRAGKAQQREPAAVQEEGNVFFCHRCGNRLYADHRYCNKCGTEIPLKNEEETV